jgi:hypothetical protein
MMNQRTTALMEDRPVPHGQERMATQRERDDVKHHIESRASNKKNSSSPINSAASGREVGDQVNRFLLCALVKESSRQLKANAGRAFPMSAIVRGVLRSYRVAATDIDGPLAGPTIDMEQLRQLNERVLRDETRRLALERVGHSQVSLARAERLGDDTRIKFERTELELAIEIRDGLLTYR